MRHERLDRATFVLWLRTGRVAAPMPDEIEHKQEATYYMAK